MTRADGLILAINSGSSSLKFAFFEVRDREEQCVLSATAEGIGQTETSLQMRDEAGGVVFAQNVAMSSPEDALELLYPVALGMLQRRPACVGYRVVHGGPHLLQHCRIDDAVLATMKESTHFAPLHIPQALSIIEHMRSTEPDAVHCACFDTTFHRTMPKVADHLPLPQRYRDAGVRRYGFHGLSYASAVQRMRPDVPERMIIAHLGNGSSLCALRHGNSIDTTMCFTPTAGIPMASRSGDVDPGVMLFLMRNYHLGPDELEDVVNHQSGLLGFTDGEPDMRAILKRLADGDAAADLAAQVYSISVRKMIGAYAALLGGVDRLVFTGGIGENSAKMRRMICGGLEFLGVRQDGDGANVWVMKAEEEREIAHICRTIG